MKNNYQNNPIIFHNSISFEQQEKKENLQLNKIAKYFLKRIKDKKEKKKVAVITCNDIVLLPARLSKKYYH